MKNESYTCSNPVCGKTCTQPVTVENLSMKNGQQYLACPYCLTAIELETEKPEVEIPAKEQILETKIPEVKEPAESSTVNCPHHFGYLSKRSADGKIPEGCMMCEKIVQCMLKNVTQ